MHITYFGHILKKKKYILKTAFSLDSKDATSIQTAKSLLEKDTIVANLAYISSHFKSLPKSIESLEAKGLALTNSRAIVESLKSDLEFVPGDWGRIALKKFKDVLAKNPGYEKLHCITAAIAGESRSINAIDLSPQEICGFKFAPVTSCDVERLFSMLKTILSDHLHNITSDNITHLLVLYSTAQD